MTATAVSAARATVTSASDPGAERESATYASVISASAAGEPAQTAPTMILSTPYAISGRDTRDALRPPRCAPSARPAMKDESTVPTAYAVAPKT